MKQRLKAYVLLTLCAALLCEIADLSALELSAQVDELDLTRVKVGDVLTYTLDAYDGETFSGTVTRIRPVGTTRQNATYFDVRITSREREKIAPEILRLTDELMNGSR